MTLVLVGIPVLQDVRRFHFDKGRRWNAVEHLVLQSLVSEARSAGDLAKESRLPRRVIVEVLIRLMRAAWVELLADTSTVRFKATQRGAAVALYDELPANLQRMARRVNFAIDAVVGAVFRRRDLTLLWGQDWTKRTEGFRAVSVLKPAELPIDFGHVATLVSTLFNEDEQLVRVDPSDRQPVERIALFTVRSGDVEGLPPRAPSALKDIIVDAAKKAPEAPSNTKPSNLQMSVRAAPSGRGRPERKVTFRLDDLIMGGAAHQAHLHNTIRRARRLLVIHSTFLDENKLDALLPDFKRAVGNGCRIEILWGQSKDEATLAQNLALASKINRTFQAAGISGQAEVSPYSTRSHSKLLIADDGAGSMVATVGSCNWLYSGFDSFELSVRLRDPHLVADVLYETAELVRPLDGQLPELSIRLSQEARGLQGKEAKAGQASVKLVVGSEHDDFVLEACSVASERITVMSHRLGVTAKPSIVIPTAAAVKRQKIAAEIYYGRPSGPVKSGDALDAKWTFREQGIELLAICRPRLHAKAILQDADVALITSLNWLSADTSASNPRQEIGVLVRSTRVGSVVRDAFNNAKLLAS